MAGTPRITIRGKTPTIHISHFTKALERVLIREQENAVRAWALAVIAKIPTYTGTVLGSFTPLNRVIRNLGITKPGITARAKAKIAAGTRIKGVEYQLGFDAGAQYGDPKMYHVVSRFKQEYIFQFNEDLPYAMWNEIYPAPSWIKLPSNPPWRAFEAGEKAFRQYAREEIPRAIVREVPFVNFLKVK